jgi:hypothetical protein
MLQARLPSTKVMKGHWAHLVATKIMLGSGRVGG